MKPYQSRYDFNDAREATVGLKEPCAGIRNMDNWFESRGGRATIIKTKAFTKETNRNNKYTYLATIETTTIPKTTIQHTNKQLPARFVN